MSEHYLLPFQSKRLNQVIIPGAHDAGIYENITSTAQCQNLDIFEQAYAGVRWFDIRVAGVKLGFGKDKNAQYEMRAIHGVGKGYKHKELETKEHKRLVLGGFGGRLEDMLKDARKFVETRPSEFLIFKISKSQNIDAVAETCIDVLGPYQFKATSPCNLNMKKVAEVGGRVITLFSSGDCAQILNNTNGMSRYDGIFSYRELYDSETKTVKGYNPVYNGIQYFGKYSNTHKAVKNTKKQGELLKTMLLSPAVHRDAMGVMYWTLTSNFGNPFSLAQSIKKRDAKMWRGPHIASLIQTWKNGLEFSIEQQMGRDFYSNFHAPTNTFGTRNDWTCFMPNVVMMDFADAQKCATVESLNYIANDTIQRMVALRDG